MFDPLPGASGPPGLAGLSSFTFAAGLRPEPDVAELHNEMAWSADERAFFLAHSRERAVQAYDLEAQRGVLGRRTADSCNTVVGQASPLVTDRAPGWPG